MNHTTLKLRQSLTKPWRRSWMTRKILLTLVSCFSLTLFAAESSEKSGMIVLLNGTSSAGKSSIVNELQEIYGNNFTVVSLDGFMSTYEKDNYDEFFDDFYKHVKNLSKNHNKVLVDTVEYEAQHEQFGAILSGNLVKILVYCPLDDIAQRVKKRKQSQDEAEHRSVRQAFEQFLGLYKKQSQSDELVIDKIYTSSIKKLLPKIKEECNGLDLSVDERVERYDKIIQAAQEIFNFNDHRKIKIVPQQNCWDLIINSGINSPAQSAYEISAFLEARN